MKIIANPKQDIAGLAISMTLVAWVFFAAVDTSVKWLVLAGLPAFQLAFMRYFISFVASVLSVFGTGGRLEAPTRRVFWVLVLRSSLLVSATALNFFALNFLSLTVTSAIMFSSPIVVCLLSMPLLGERVGPWRWAAIMLGFAGVLTVIRPFGDGFHWASILILYNASAMALFSILTRKLSGVVPPATMQMHMGALGSIALLPLALWTWQSPTSPLDWALMLGLGIFAWIGHELYSRAHGFADAATIGPFSYAFIIYLTISSYLVFGTLPDQFTILGAAIIVASGLLIWWRENQVTNPTRSAS